MYSDEHFSDKDDFGAETFEARDDSWCVNHGWIHTARAGDIIPCTSCNDMICEGCRCGGCGNCENSDCCECKNAETDPMWLDKVKHQHYKDMIAHLESRNDLSEMDKVKLQHYKDMLKMGAETFEAKSNLSEATLKRLRRTYDTYEDTNQHTANYLLLATFFGTDAEKDEVKKIMKRRDRRGYLTQEESDWMYKNINPYYDHLRNVKATETFGADEDEEGKFYDDLQEKIQAKQKEIEDLKEYMDKVAYGRSELLELDSLEQELAELEEMEFMGAETFGSERQELCIWGCGSKVYKKGEPCYSCKYGAETFEAKGIDTLAKPFEEIGIPKTYARLGVITAGITALAFGVMKLKDR